MGITAETLTALMGAARGKQLFDAMNRLQRATKALKALTETHDDEPFAGFQVKNDLWFATWTNSFEDRAGDIFPQKALDAYVARVDAGDVEPPQLWSWHTPGTRMGQAAWVARHGHFMIAVGTFDDTADGRAGKAYYAKHSKDLGVSHGFTYPPAQYVNGTFEYFDTFEISPLPRGSEANSYTWYEAVVQGAKAMAVSDKKRKHLEAIFGVEGAKKKLAELDKRGKELEQLGVAYKSVKAEDTDAPATEDEPRAEILTLLGDAFTEAEIDAMIAEYGLEDMLIAARNPVTQALAKPADGSKQLRDMGVVMRGGKAYSAFWGIPLTDPQPAVKASEQLNIMHPFSGLRVKSVGSISMLLNVQDAIKTMAEALNLQQPIVDAMQRKWGDDEAYALLKDVIEAGGGSVQFRLEAKR